MKKLVSAVMLIAILLSLSACGGSAKPESSIKPEMIPQTTPESTPVTEPDATPTPEPVPAVSISIENMTGSRSVDGFEVGYYNCDYPVVVVNGKDSSEYDELSADPEEGGEDDE